jgi:hypothetical protein
MDTMAQRYFSKTALFVLFVMYWILILRLNKMGGIFSTHAETRTTSNILASFSQAQIAANYSNASAKLQHAGVNWTDLDHDGKNWNSVVNTVKKICDQ